MRRVLFVASLGFAWVFPSAASASALVLCHHWFDFLTTPCEELELTPPTEAVDLYVYGGSNPNSAGEICLSGNGDEVCGVDVTLEIAGGFQVDFSPGPNVVGSSSPGIFAPQLRIVAVLDPAPGSVSAVYLGRMTASLGTEARIAVVAGQGVKGSGELVPVSFDTIGITPAPEPGEWLLLGTGLLTLAALRRAGWRASA